MSSNSSINKIDLLFKSIFAAHPSIQGRYRMGPDLDLSSNELDYPRIHIVPVSSSINQNLTVHRLSIMCVDIAKQDDNEMIKEVWSDTHSILEDVVKFIRAYTGDPGWFDITNNPQTQPILEDYRDRFTGHAMTLDLQVDLTGPCDVPLFDVQICGYLPTWFPNGPQGQSGRTGPQGPQGFQGNDGLGSQGFQGPIGFQGSIGAQGFQGLEGLQGFQGRQGFQGILGTDGANAANSLYWVSKKVEAPGNLIFDNVAWASLNQVNINNYSYVNSTTTVDSYFWLRTMSTWNNISTVYIQFNAVGNPSNYAIYSIGSMVDNGTFWSVPTDSLVNSSGTYSIDDAVYVVSYTVIGENGDAGPQGPQGFQGRQGIAGIQGFQGRQGIQGLVGFQGNQGFQGLSATGTQGLQGLQGRQGLIGNTGSQGFQGWQGPGTVQVTSLTMSQASWTYSAPFWNYTITNASILSDTYVQVIPNNANYAIVFAAFLLPANLSSVGQVIVYALNQPTGDIGVTINIIKAL